MIAQRHRLPGLQPLPAATAPDDLLQTLVFRASLLLLFLHCSTVHEVIAHQFGVQLYAMFILIPLCTVGLFLTGGVRVALRHTAVKCWLLLAFWAVICIPFSSWMGGSVDTVSKWFKAPLEVAVIYAGVFTTWQRIRAAFYVVAAALPVNIMVARTYSQGSSRLGLDFEGTIANPNDFAAHLLLICGIATFVALTRKMVVSRLTLLALVAFALALVFQTGSRGALVGVVVATLVFLLRATAMQRIVMVVAVPACAFVILAGVSPDVRARLLSFETSETVVGESEASGSQRTREYLLKASIKHTLAHPVFGVGPGQFGTYEGGQKRERGGHGAWYSPHNSIMQIFSECGLPGGFFLCAALILSWRTLKRIWREAEAFAGANRYRDAEGRGSVHSPRRYLASGEKPHPDVRRGDFTAPFLEISRAAFWFSISFAAFIIATLFLNFGYSFHYPTIIGLTAGLKNAFDHEKSLASYRSTAVESAIRERTKGRAT